jgi:Domain of unknown function (DUF4845)
MKNLRIAFWLFVVVAAVYTGWRVVPAYISNYRLEETIDDSARAAAVNSQRSEDEIRLAVYREAQNLHIPIKPEDIKVQRDAGEVVISADYTVHVDLPVHPIDLDFHPSSKRETFR